jgi:hypothetical protein
VQPRFEIQNLAALAQSQQDVTAGRTAVIDQGILRSKREVCLKLSSDPLGLQ